MYEHFTRAQQQFDVRRGDVTVVFLTSQPKKDMSTHVTIRTTGRISEALCEQPTTISVERLNNRIGSVTEREMQQIDIALQIALNLDAGANTQPEAENQWGVHRTVAMLCLKPNTIASYGLKRSATHTRNFMKTL